MHFVRYLENSLTLVLPALLAAVGIALVILLVQWLLIVRRKDVDPRRNIRRQLVRLLLTVMFLGSIMLILSLIDLRKQSATLLAGLLGIVFSAAITISRLKRVKSLRAQRNGS